MGELSSPTDDMRRLCRDKLAQIGLPHAQINAFLPAAQAHDVDVWQALRVQLGGIAFQREAATTAPATLAWWAQALASTHASGHSEHPLLNAVGEQISQSDRALSPWLEALRVEVDAPSPTDEAEAWLRVYNVACVSRLIDGQGDEGDASQRLLAGCQALERIASIGAGDVARRRWLPMNLRARYADKDAALLQSMAKATERYVSVTADQCTTVVNQYFYLCWQLARRGIGPALARRSAVCYPRSGLWVLWRSLKRLKKTAVNQT